MKKTKYNKYHIIVALLAIALLAFYGGNLLSVSPEHYRVTTTSINILDGGSIRLINPTDCCVPTIEVTTPWGTVETAKISPDETVVFTNEDNPSETYVIHSDGQTVYEDTIKRVCLSIYYTQPIPIETPITIPEPEPKAVDKNILLILLLVIVACVIYYYKK